MNDGNVKDLSLAWVYGIGGSGDERHHQGNSGCRERRDVLHCPDKVWAIDARTGRELWRYTWASKGGIHLGNRGVGMYGNWLYFETPDCNLVSLDANDGKLRWSKPICDLDEMYYASVGSYRDQEPCHCRRQR